MNHVIKTIAKRLIPRWLCATRLRPNAGNTILLTFDDGPHPEATPAVLDRLREHEARAIFFVVGNRIDRAPKMLSRILDEGHWLGNHTYSHPNDRPMPYRQYLNDLLKCQEAIFDLTGTRPRLHRPPAGQLPMASLFAPKKCGLVTMNWSRSAEDWLFRSDTAAVSRADEMMDEVDARDILLFHDERLHTVVALDRLLPALRSRGYEFSPNWEQFA